MPNPTKNEMMSTIDYDEYRDRSARFRFMNQMLLGVGGATVFGLVTACATTLANLVGAGGTFEFLGLALSTQLVAGVALATLTIGGISAIYFGSKFLTKNIILDQDFQARKIGLMARSGQLEPTRQTEINQPSPQQIPTQPGIPGSVQSEQATPSEKVSAVELDPKWRERTVTTHRSEPDKITVAKDQNWAQRTAAMDAAALAVDQQLS